MRGAVTVGADKYGEIIKPYDIYHLKENNFNSFWTLLKAKLHILPLKVYQNFYGYLTLPLNSHAIMHLWGYINIHYALKAN